jgi:hypothetical protein
MLVYLFDDHREQLLLQTIERHSEVDDVDLDKHARKEMGVSHPCCKVQPGQKKKKRILSSQRTAENA